MLSNIPTGFDDKYIPRDTFCINCGLVEGVEGNDGLTYCEECEELIDQREPLDYQPENE